MDNELDQLKDRVATAFEAAARKLRDGSPWQLETRHGTLHSGILIPVEGKPRKEWPVLPGYGDIMAIVMRQENGADKN